MQSFELVLGDETYHLRLTSANCMALEQVSKKGILDLVQDASITNIVRMLEYMCKTKENNFGQKDAQELYDKLVDYGYTLFDIMYKVIYEGMVISGFLTHAELEEMIDSIKNGQKKVKQLIQEKL